MSRVARLQRYPQTSGAGAQLIQCDPGGSKLVAIGGIDVAVPELRAKPEAGGEVENDIGVGAGFAGRRDDGWAKLDQ